MAGSPVDGRLRPRAPSDAERPEVDAVHPVELATHPGRKEVLAGSGGVRHDRGGVPRQVGVEPDHVHARLNAVNTVNDLLSIAHALGSVRTQRLTGRDAKRLRQAARSGTFDLYTGKKDRLLRRLTVSVKLGFDVPDVLRSALGHVVGADVLFDLGVASPNRVVSVAAPPNALPYSSLPSSK